MGPRGFAELISDWRGTAFGACLLVAACLLPALLPAASLARVPESSPCAVPGAPGTPSAAAGKNRATVTWSPASDNGTAITAYVVRARSGATAGESVAGDSSATSATLGGLAGGSSVAFSIAAVSPCGTGPAATTAAVTPTGVATTFETAVHADHPVADYRLSDPAGSIMTDSSGASADGQYSGQEALGQPGALPGDPDPSTGYTTCCAGVGAGTAHLPQYDSPRTVEAWIKTTSANQQVIAIYGNGGTEQTFIVGVLPSAIIVDGAFDFHTIRTPRPVNDGAWHLVTVTYSGGVADGYLDGRLAGTALFNDTLDTLGQTLTIGATPYGGYTVWSGDLQDVAVYPAALSAARVKAQFSASGYRLPGIPQVPHAAGAGSNAAQITWGASPNSPVVGYRVTVASGPNAGESTAVPGDATAATLTSLGAGSTTFTIAAYNAYGTGAAVTTNAFTVTGAKSTYATTVLAAGPSAYYRLGDSTDTFMSDSSGHGGAGQYNPGNAVLNVPGALPGDLDTAVGDTGNFTGYAGSYPSLPAYNDARTVEVWIQIQSTAPQSATALWSWGQNVTDSAFSLWAEGPRSLLVSGGFDDHFFMTPYPLDDGAWHQVTVTYDGATIRLYLDGRPIGTSHFNAPLDTTPGGLFALGQLFTGCCGVAGLHFDELAVYPKALSAAEVAAHFAASGYSRPSAPGSPAATTARNRATVSWSPASAANAPVLGYLVTALKGGTAKADSVAVSGTAKSAVVTGLIAGASYKFSVQAVNSYGYGPAATTPAAVTPSGAASTYASTVLSHGPSLYYRLGDSTTAAMADSSGHGATGLYNGANVTFGATGAIPGDPDTAVADQGRGGGYATSDAALPLHNDARTVELWVKSSIAQSTGVLVSWGQPRVDNGFGIDEANPTRIDVWGFADDHLFSTPYPLDDGMWHLVAVTYDGSTIAAYLDGRVLGTAHFNGMLDTLPGRLFIGSDLTGGAPLLGAELDELAIFPSALSGSAIAAQFAASGYGRPSAPGSPAATAGANRATVTWTAASAPHAPIAGYLVTALRGGTTKVNAVAVAAGATSAVVGGLAGGASYKFTVQAIDAYGYGAAATTASAAPSGAASTYSSTVLGDGPTVYYRLGDSTPVSLADSAGRGAAGFYNAGHVTFGAAGPITGDPGTAAAGDGQNVAASTAAHVPLFDQPRTVEAWIRAPDPFDRYIIASGRESNDAAFDVDIDGGHVYARGYGDDLGFTTSTNLADGNWHYVAVTTNGSSATAYVDGVSLGTQTFPAPLDTLPGGALVVGGYANGCCGINGNIAQVAIYPKVLSAARIKAHYQAAQAGAA